MKFDVQISPIVEIIDRTGRATTNLFILILVNHEFSLCSIIIAENLIRI